MTTFSYNHKHTHSHSNSPFRGLGGFLLLILLALTARGQETRKLTLSQAIDIAREGSVDAAVAINQLRSSYWEYRTYRAQYLPEVNFTATLPTYNKRYSAYQLTDGTYTFVRDNYLGLSGALSIDQNIPLTGGTLSLQTSLDFLRQLDSGAQNRYMSIPVALTLSQPIFGVNTLKWDKKIEPVRYREAQAAYLEATEQVAMSAISYYFNLLLAKVSVEVAEQNLDNAVRLAEVAKVQRNMGRISKNDSLQMELNVLDARSTLTSAQSTYKSSMFNLRSFLGFEDDVVIEAEVPEHIEFALVDYDDALQKALEYNDFSLNIRRRQLEADYSVAQAKGNLREITLYAQFGYTGTGQTFKAAYDPLKDNQVIQLGIQIPLLDWGKRRGQVKVAESNRQLVEAQLRQEAMNFRQDLFILVERFNNQQQQVLLAEGANDIAGRRYATNVETFVLGRISTLDLNDSQVKKDEARSDYIYQLYYYWYYYYQLRSLTLWDYALGTNIDADFDRLIKN